jgi:hypothetical protein
MTPETSSPSERQLDVSLGTLTRLKEMAVRAYNEAMSASQPGSAGYWDGYIRAIDHVLEADGQ